MSNPAFSPRNVLEMAVHHPPNLDAPVLPVRVR